MSSAYYRARKLAAKLGCTIEIERIGNYRNYLVHGPVEIYYGTDDRKDPYEGNHVCVSWPEVLDNLKVYQTDLFFHRLGIDSEYTTEIINLDDTGIVPDIIKNNDTAGLLILADWIEDFKPGNFDCCVVLRLAHAYARQLLDRQPLQ